MKKKLIKLSKSSLGKEEKISINRVIDEAYLGMGKYVESFEEMLSKYFDRECICVSSGTAALQIALQSLDLDHGDEVLVPSITYVSTFQAISANGLNPVPCDIEQDTMCIDPKEIIKKINKKSRVIIPVHYAGRSANMIEIKKIANDYNLRIIEDAAHAFGSYYNDELVGSSGDIVCFSFDGIKNITSGEGGCIVSQDKKVINSVKSSRLLGIERETEFRYKSERNWNVDVRNQGWRYHMSNLNAAIGIEQLKKSNSLFKKRKQLADHYTKMLSESDLINPIIKNFQTIVPHIYVVRIEGLKNRDSLRQYLLENNIETGVHYYPNHKLSFFIEKYGNFEELPITNTLFPEILTLPLHPDLSIDDVDYVCFKLLESIKKYV